MRMVPTPTGESSFLAGLASTVPDILEDESIHSLRMSLLVEAAVRITPMTTDVIDTHCYEEFDMNDIKPPSASFEDVFAALHPSRQMLVRAIFRRHLTLPTHILILDWHHSIAPFLNHHLTVDTGDSKYESRGFTTSEYRFARTSTERTLCMTTLNWSAPSCKWQRLGFTHNLTTGLHSCTDYHHDKYSVFYLLSPYSAERDTLLQWISRFFDRFLEPPIVTHGKREPLEIGVELIDFPIVSI